VHATTDLTTTATSRARIVRVPGYREALRDYGFSEDDVRPEPLVVRSGETVHLAAQPGQGIHLSRLQTHDVDQFKRWIGVADRDLDEGVCVPPARMPGAWTRALEGPIEQLTSSQWHDVLLAANYYLFGDSRRVGQFRTAIECHLAPFWAALYAVEYLFVEAGGTLVVSGDPAIVLVGTLDLEQGGRLMFHSPLRMLVETMSKQAATGGSR
jgi:hypothetical protein